MTEILFDLETKIKNFLSSLEPQKLGLEETGISIGERQQEAAKPEPEKIEAPTRPEPKTAPISKQDMMPAYSPQQKTKGNSNLVNPV